MSTTPPRPAPAWKMGQILRRLRQTYGPRPWKCWGRGVDVLVGTILSQNTSNANSSAGYRQLRRQFNSWTRVADAPVDQIERHIRISGLSRQKAPRIRQILREIRDDRGAINLQFLAEMDEQSAYDYLIRFNGVGPKTANCVLLFAFGHFVFPVDTHIHRIARRLQLIEPRTSAEDAHDVLKPMIVPRDRHEMHVLLIAHGRATCRAMNPRCGECVLLDRCPFGQVRVSAARDKTPSAVQDRERRRSRNRCREPGKLTSSSQGQTPSRSRRRGRSSCPPP